MIHNTQMQSRHVLIALMLALNISVLSRQASGQDIVSSTGISETDSDGACSGSPPYPCALTDLSNPPFVVPNVGGLLGANTVYIDNFSGAAGVRITDYYTIGSSPVQPSYQVDAGGSAEVNFMSSDDQYFFVTDLGNDMEPFSWNGTTMQATHMYASYYPSTNGARLGFGAGGEFSYTIPGRLYFMASGSAGVCGVASSPCIAYYDLTQSDPTNHSKFGPIAVKDLGADSACYPNGWTVDGHVVWADPVTVSNDDQTFATAYSITGGQDTGVLFVVWNRTNGCRWWETDNATIGGAWGPTGSVVLNGGAPDTFETHNARLSLDGTYLKGASGGGCVGTCFTNYFWNIATLNVESSSTTKSGHSTIGYSHVVNSATCPWQSSIQWAPMGNLTGNHCPNTPGTSVCIANCGGSSSPPNQSNWDTHLSWSNASSSDNNIFFGSSNVAKQSTPTQAWNNEVLGYDAAGSGTVWRFGRNYITAVPTSSGNTSFSASVGVGSVSADGKWFAFASDWDCELGSNTGGAEGTTSPYNCRADVFMLSLTGAGTAPAASVSPTGLSFGNENVGSTSQAQTVTLNNTGNASLSISAVVIGPDYTQTNNCGSTVAAGGSCSFTVSFAPTAPGSLNESLQITDNANGSPQSVTLTGTGTQPAISLSPNSLTFGNQAVGTSRSGQSVTLTNTGTATLTLNSISISGVNAGDFSQTNTCGGSVAAGSNCTITVTFAPTATGTRSANLSIADNAPGNPQTVSFSGTGTALQLSQTSLSFGPIKVGNSSAVKTITLANLGSTTVSITRIGITGTNAGDFKQTNTCGSSIGAGQSCAISVAFTPLATGTRTAILGVMDSDGGSPQSPQMVTLSGTGS